MTVTLNGAPRELPEGSTIGSLLDLLGAARTGVAVAQNETVVQRRRFDAHAIADGDRIEIIRAVAGG